MTATFVFSCSICGEPSQSICVYCTKDACGNHLCERCHRCSDCCECEVRLDEHTEHEYAALGTHTAIPPQFAIEPETEAVAQTASVEDIDAVEEAETADPVETVSEAAEPEAAEPAALEEEAPAESPAQPAGDLSKLFAPEPEPGTPDAAVPLFAPEPGTPPSEETSLPQPPPEGDWSKLFAPEDEPGKPVFPTTRAPLPTQEGEPADESKPETDGPESGDPS